ncbi:hypothetical protein CDD80_4972 [Ophiocordyceps camponoti-rufipedis]|uniref:Phosphatidate cytidylyltransferase, mitochondrial n=1 Tax=Ophiocordyceps camponoti-rufipedis TaxID=2004952 RepID=A0A2C5YVQ8_9HYPO|nr:hypothetical protein CDD80_4972 [Ophiocordyceps camponoti-rufipedis]
MAVVSAASLVASALTRRCVTRSIRLARYSSSSSNSSSSSPSTSSFPPSTSPSTPSKSPTPSEDLYDGTWEDSVDFAIRTFDELPHRLFGINQHMIINHELKEALRLMLRQFNAPIVYCFAYGSGVFPQQASSSDQQPKSPRSVHSRPPEALIRAQGSSPRMIDFIFGVSHMQHWHSVNMRQHPHHYSAVASLGSGFVSRVQRWGAGVYFNPYVDVNGMLIKYGVTSIDNLVDDLSTWQNLYLAGRLQKPVKILRDHPRVRLANQHNLIAALRTALLLLPAEFDEGQLYATIAGLSYLGDPRMALPTEDRSKIANMVCHNAVHFRRLYAPLIRTLPNVVYLQGPVRFDDQAWLLDPRADTRLRQDMDPVRRANMVRRLPGRFRARLYHRYRKEFGVTDDDDDGGDDDSGIEKTVAPTASFQGGPFDRRIASDDPQRLHRLIRLVVRQTVNWPSTAQSVKGLLMGGWQRSWRYLGDKFAKWRAGRDKRDNKG